MRWLKHTRPTTFNIVNGHTGKLPWVTNKIGLSVFLEHICSSMKWILIWQCHTGPAGSCGNGGGSVTQLSIAAEYVASATLLWQPCMKDIITKMQMWSYTDWVYPASGFLVQEIGHSSRPYVWAEAQGKRGISRERVMWNTFFNALPFFPHCGSTMTSPAQVLLMSGINPAVSNRVYCIIGSMGT